MSVIKFWPKEQFPAEVMAHRKGKDFTFCDCTDTIQDPPRYSIEYFLYKNNMPVGAFIGKHYPSDWNDIRECELTGAIRFDNYYLSGSGAGTIAEVDTWFFNLLNRHASAGSYAGGWDVSSATKPFWLGGRNSLTGTTSYGKHNGAFLGSPALDYSHDAYIYLPGGIRWYDDHLDDNDWSAVKQAVIDTAGNGGRLVNFAHWHWLRNGNGDNPGNVVYKIGDFHKVIKDTAAAQGKTVYCCSYGESTEYMAYRQLITRVACYESLSGNVRIAVEADNLFLQDRLNTPISIKVDLSTSSLAGKHIRATNNCDIVDLGGDQYIVDVPFRIDEKTNKIMVIELSEGAYDYYTEIPPVITVTTGANYADVITDVPCNGILFYKAKGAAEDTYNKVTRDVVRLKYRRFENLNFTANDYAVGMGNKFRQLAIATF